MAGETLRPAPEAAHVKVRGERTLAKKWARRVRKSAQAFAEGAAAPIKGKPRKVRSGGREWVKATASKASKWARGWAPYRRVLIRLKLPPRGPVRSKRNVERALMVVQALHQEKMRREKKAR